MPEKTVLIDEIRSAIADIAEVEPALIKPESEFVRDLDMDSLMALEMLAMLEKKYGIEIREEALPSMVNLDGVVRVVSEQLESGRGR